MLEQPRARRYGCRRPAADRRAAADRSTVSLNAPTHGPVALTSTRALATSRRPRTSRTSRQASSPRSARARSGCGCGSTAPRSAASSALSTTRRASSTQQSEYSKPRSIAALERRAERVAGEVDGARARQELAAAEMVVDEQPEAQHPAPAACRARPAARSASAGSDAAPLRSMTSRSISASRTSRKPAVLEIAQAAVDELGRGRRGAGGEVVLLDQQHAQAAAGGVARDAGAVDAAADNRRGRNRVMPIRLALVSSMARRARRRSSLASGACIGDDAAALRKRGGPMDFRDRHVVVTGGTGALGERRGRRAGRGRRDLPCALCRGGGSRALRLARARRRSSCVAVTDLADEAAVDAPLRRRAAALGVDPSRRRLRHGAGRARPPRPT